MIDRYIEHKEVLLTVLSNRIPEKIVNEIIKSNKLWIDRKDPVSLLKTGKYDVIFTMIYDIPNRKAYWIRYTYLLPRYSGKISERSEIPEKVPGVRSSLWFAAFDADDPGRNFIIKKIFPGKLPEVPGYSDGDYIFAVIDNAKLGIGGMSGGFSAGGRTVEWDLKFDDIGSPFYPVPSIAEKLRITTTGINVTHPAVKISGTISVNGKEYILEGVPGEQTHTYGLGYHDEKIWFHANRLNGDPKTWAEFGYKEGKGTFGFYDGNELYAFNRISTMKRFTVRDVTPEHLNAVFRYKDTKIEIEVNVPHEELLGVEYVGPDGSAGYCYNSEVADIFLKISKGGEVREYKAEASTAWETHYLEPKEGYRLLKWDDEYIQ